MEASSTWLPTWTTMPPRMSGSTREDSSTRRPVCSAMRSPMLLDGLLVELDRGGHVHRQELVALLPQPVVLAPDAEDRRHAVVLQQQLEEVEEDRLGTVDRPPQAVHLLLGGEVRREEEDLEPAVAVERVGELAELLAHLVELVLVVRRLEQRAGVDGGDLLHGLALRPLPGQRGEVQLGQRLVDEPPLVLGGERLARHLLRGHDGEVGDLGADLLDRAACLRLDVAARLGRAAPPGAPSPWPPRRPPAARPPCARGRRCRRPGRAPSVSRSRYSASSLSASRRVRSAVSIGLLDRLLAAVQRLADAREGELGEQEHREAEDEQRPDHQPDVRA